MRVALGAQPLLDRFPTGVGRYESELLRALLRRGAEDDRWLLTYFIRRSRRSDKACLRPFVEAGAEDAPCRLVYSRVYNAAKRVVPVPYSVFFPKADVTHFFNYDAPAGVRGGCVLTVYDMVFRDMPETMQAKNRARLAAVLDRSVRRADVILTISQFSRERILHYYDIPPEKVAVAPCGVDTEVFRRASDGDIAAARTALGLPEHYLLYTGTLEPRKNLSRLLDAYAMLCEKRSDLPPLVLAGASGWDSGEAASRAAVLGDRVLTTGFVPKELLVPLMSGAEVFLFPSLYEGFGLPPLEAMACGVPVLTSSAASLPEVCGDCAVYADPLSADSIADGIDRLVYDGSLRTRLAAAGPQRARQFTWDAAADIVYGIYKGLC